MITFADNIYEFIKRNSPCEEKWIIDRFKNKKAIWEILRIFEKEKLIKISYSVLGSMKVIAVVNGHEMNNNIHTLKHIFKGD